MKWYSVELSASVWDALRRSLCTAGFQFEKLDADLEMLVHISIYAAPESVDAINTMIDEIL